MSSSFESEVASNTLAALLESVAIAPLAEAGWLRVTGEDRVRWLNGMVTNSIQALQQGEGCFNFFLNAQGRIQGDATVFLVDDTLLLETDRERIPGLTTLLDRFIIMDDVELQEPEERAGLLVAGPEAAHLLTQNGLPLSVPQGLRLVRTSWQGSPVELVHAFSPVVPRFELWSDRATITSLGEALRQAGAASLTAQDLEALRMLEGRPKYGVDIREKELPQETAQTRALHFAKGCYLGQEIVERIHSRGSVHRTLAGFVLDGPPPPSGSPLFAADAPDKPAGELTSSATVALRSGPKTLALGYIRREVLDRGVALLYAGGKATVSPLPVAFI